MTGTRVLGERYELGRMIGRGGMAEVYAAHDRLLDREVAVKVLRERFREDAAFTGRFHDEARHVARLAHPNLVVVHDTGSQDGQPYIVMERIRGRTLQEALDAGGLTEDRSLQVAADVCGALAYAHANGLVHRDVKPGNIMLAEDGSVKVTDFGIARAISDETVTVTAAVLGTAAYLSPEQAQGRRVDARSDLYSLGVVLYELLTGKVPFSGDSAVAVALQHVRATPEAPRRLAPAVSKASETIALRLLEKDPARRYQQAEDVRIDLERARRGESPLPLRPPNTRRGPVVGAVGAAGATGATGAAAGTVRADEIASPAAGSATLSDDATLLDTGSSVPARRDDPRERVRRLAGYLAFALAAVAVFVGARVLLASDAPSAAPVPVPLVVGLPFEQARDLLEAADLRVGRIAEVETESVAPGVVLTQQYEAGTSLGSGLGVDLTVARSPALTTVPSVAGLSESDARERLRAVGLVPGTRIRAPSDVLPAGLVISTLPGPGTRVALNTTVDITVSDGPARAAVRSVTNRPLPEAFTRLTDQGFEVDVYEEANPAVAPGLVIRQVPLAGQEAVLGSTVMIWVSTGPDGSAPLPDLPPSDGDGGGDGNDGSGDSPVEGVPAG